MTPILLLSTLLIAQAPPPQYPPRLPPLPAGKYAPRPAGSPQQRRMAIESTVSTFGDEVRPLCEAHRDLAVAALQACSMEVGKKLGHFYTEGRLSRIPKVKPVLHAIARGGDPVALYVMECDDLVDPQRLDAFLAGDAMEYALYLKTLDEGVAEREWPLASWISLGDWRGVALILGLVALGGVLGYLCHRRGSSGSGHWNQSVQSGGPRG